MDFESAYMETLAYMFKNKHIDGIPISPFSRAKDKFNMILLESRDKESGSVRYDFVHPSYHEAFWYTKHKPTMHRWWELLKGNLGEILKDLKNKVDLVQLRMIERYGTINRDLDQLLLLSAGSDDVDEQLIALEHMMERPEQFTNLPQFSRCVQSVISSKNKEHRDSFLNMVEKHFDQLPLDLLNAVPSFLFDDEKEVRRKAEEIILRHFYTLPKSVKQCDKMQAWRVIQRLFLSPREGLGSKHDAISRLEEEYLDGRKIAL